MNGIDVSKWQGEINWDTVKKAGIEFAIIRASYGSESTDKYFKSNANNAVKAGIKTGAYHYCYAKNKQEATVEARYFLSVINGFELSYPIILDMEDGSLSDLGKNVLTDICIAFLGEVQNAGYFSMLYANRSWLQTKLDMQRLKDYDIWLAEYDKPNYTYSGSVGIWQYTSKGSVNGINGNVDMNKSYKDYDSIIKKAGLNHLKGGNDMEDIKITLDEAEKIIQQKCGFDDNTMKYLGFYKYSESMILRLAEAMK